jgi:YesN/AraC family two-component response regulator
MNDVADHVGYSPVYLSKMFKLRHGISFKKYLLTKRLNFARSLLLSTSLDYRCGGAVRLYEPDTLFKSV